jgi:hypothetical protein
MYRFLVTASILVLLGFVYLGQRLIAEIWGKNLQLALWLILGAMIANLLWLPFKRWRRQMAARPNPQNETVARYLEASAYNLMGLLSLLLLFSVLSDVLRLVFRVLPQSLQGDILVAIPAGQNLDSILALAVMVVAALFFIWGRIDGCARPTLSLRERGFSIAWQTAPPPALSRSQNTTKKNPHCSGERPAHRPRYQKALCRARRRNAEFAER